MIDTHTHLNDPKFANDLDDVIKRANSAGVTKMIVCGYDLKSSYTAVDIAERYDCAFAAVGIHPHEAQSVNAQTIKELSALARMEKVVAIGETGLDFYYNLSPWPQQTKAFEQHIELAIELGMPLIVHTRQSGQAALEILKQYAHPISGVFHCFSSNEELAQEVIDRGFYIGIAGTITFPTKATAPVNVLREPELRQVVSAIPADRILIETDCPYLAPVPHRGKRNEPAYLPYVADAVAQALHTTAEDIDIITSQNAERLFGKIDAAARHRNPF